MRVSLGIEPDADSANTIPPDVTISKDQDGTMTIQLQGPDRIIKIDPLAWEAICRTFPADV